MCCFGIQEYCLMDKRVYKKEKVICSDKHCTHVKVRAQNVYLDLAPMSLVTLMRALWDEWWGA